MKKSILLSLTILLLLGCTKETEEAEEKLIKTKVDLTNVWQVHSIQYLEPERFKGFASLDDCFKKNTWTFDDDGSFSIIEDVTCNPFAFDYIGFWKIENKNNLKITYTQGGSRYRDFIISKVTPDTLKLKMLITIVDIDNTRLTGVQEYTFIPK